MAEKFSSSLISTAAAPAAAPLLARLFEQALGGKPDSYAWELHPKGSVLYYDGDVPIVAEWDMVGLFGLRKG